MNNKIYIFLFAGLLGLLTSCKDFLDQQPEASLDAQTAISNVAGARAAIIGVYGNLTAVDYYGLHYVVFADLAADNLAHNGTFPTFAQVKNRNILPDNVNTTNMWHTLYRGIDRANNVLEKVPAIEDPAFTDKARIIAEARFLRALHYFDLVRLWGDVPLILTATKVADQSLNVSRTPVNEVYQQILADLDAAEPDLPESAPGRATKSAVKALKSRIALFRGDYPAAGALAEEIIASNRFSLVPNYRALFDTKNSSESIFEVQFDNVNGNSLAFYNYPVTLGGRNEVGPRGLGSTLEAAYEPNDTRKSASISPGGIVIDGRTIPAGVNIKYFRPGTGEDNVHLIRYAEVLLTHAEALARQGNLEGSLVSLNKVRARAGLPALETDDQQALIDAILKERRIELAMEGHRWFDLIRTGQAQSVLGITDSNKLLFPIPQREIINNPNMEQNPGY
jgi:starch-binding outer membrane protein, SusD/RagB family